MNKKTAFLIGICFTAACVQIIRNIVHTLNTKNLVDFEVYREASSAFLHGNNPYRLLFTNIPFNYPPSSFLFLQLFTFFPAFSTQLVLSVVSLVCLVFTLWIIRQKGNIRISLPFFFVVSAFFIQTFPVKFTLILGQINLIVLCITFLSMLFYHKAWFVDGKKKVLWFCVAGVLLSIASSIKLFPLYTLPLFLLLGDIPFVLFVVICFGVVSALMSVPLSVYYYTNVLFHMTPLLHPPFYDQSLTAFFLRLFHSYSVSLFCAGGISLGFYILGFIGMGKVRNSMRNREKESFPLFLFFFSYILAVVSISNPFSWQHHLVFSYPYLMLLFFLPVWKQGKSMSLRRFFWFLVVWLGLVLHFPSATHPLLSNPLLASYQTILLLVCLGRGIQEIQQKEA